MNRELFQTICNTLEYKGHVLEDIMQIYIGTDGIALVEFALINKPIRVDIKNQTVEIMNVDFTYYVEKCNA